MMDAANNKPNHGETKNGMADDKEND